jgi:hypothetical protein
MIATVAYDNVPGDVSRIEAYAWYQGAAPLSVPVAIGHDGNNTTITFTISGAVVVRLERADHAYVLDGPFVLHGQAEQRRVDGIWRHTLTGTVGDVAAAGAPLGWVSASGATGAAWPSCWWAGASILECTGVELVQTGVVLGTAAGRVLSVIAGPGGVSPWRETRWARVLLVLDRDGSVPPALRVTAERATTAPQRARTVRLQTSVIADIRETTIAPGVFWVAGDSSPPDAWLEIRSARSGPLYLSLGGFADGSPFLPARVSLDDTRSVAATVVSSNGTAAAGALVTTFRLIDALDATRRPGEPPPRSVLAGDTTAAADGTATIAGLGEADYEVVAWHPQWGRGSVRLRPGASIVTVRLQAPAMARGRVLVGGKPASGVPVITVPDPAVYMVAEDPLQLKGGDTRSGPDGRFALPLAERGGGELRIGGGEQAVVRIPLPSTPLPLVELGDIEIGGGITVSVVLDQDPGCDVRAVGPVGRSGLHILTATRTGPGLFSLVFPEPGAWEFVLLCGRDERRLVPDVANIEDRSGTQELRLSVR